jgi:hypothetical protein
LETLKKFIKLYAGSSFPTEIETLSDRKLILKMRGTGNGAKSLVSEFIVNRMASRIGWNVPSAELVKIPDQFPWEFGTDEFDDLLQKSYGINLGLQLIEEAVVADISNIATLPIDLLYKMATIDIFFCNFDRQKQSQNLLKDQNKKFWLIDHASCFFLESGFKQQFTLNPNHILKEREKILVNPAYLKKIADRSLALVAIEELPSEWLEEIKLAKKDLLHIIDTRIELAKKLY